MMNRRPGTHEPSRWQLLIETTLNVAAIFALVCGGIWALYEFFALRSAERAEVELQILQIETERLPIIEVKVDASPDISCVL